MKLAEYVKAERGRQSDIATALRVPPQLVNQWSKGWRPVPVVRCVALEQATQGAVRRWDLRPDDWHQHWPELIGTKGAPRVLAVVA